MLEINGNLGEAGGQIVRSSLALAMLTGKSFRMVNVRAGRKPPGLKKQHMTAVTAAARVCNACVSGNTLGSSEFTFEPNDIQPGVYQFDIGTAGSTTLIMQTLLPAMMFAEKEFQVEVTGGTHNPWAPTFDFLEQAYLPVLHKLGAKVNLKLHRHGFFPKGGGKISASVSPNAHWKSINLLERGQETDRITHALVAKLPTNIAERECKTITANKDWRKTKCRIVETVESFSPGNVVSIELRFQNIVEVFTALGKIGLPAQKVAKTALKEAEHYLKSNAVVGEYLADQIMLPMAIAAHLSDNAYQYRTLTPSDHSTTHAELIRQFLEVEVEMEELSKDDFVIKIQKQ